MNYKEIILEAFAAATQAAQDMIDKNPGSWFPCGFASIKISPARGPFVKALKEMKEGETDSYEGGYVVYNPSKNPTQWMDAKGAGAEAFAKVLRAHGVKCSVKLMID